MSIDVIQTVHTCSTSHQDSKYHRWALEGLGQSFGHKLVRLRLVPSTKHKLEAFSWRLECQIPIWSHWSSLWILFYSKWCILMVCDVPLLRFSVSLGEVLQENQSTLHFVSHCLAPGRSWISLMVLPEGTLHVCYQDESIRHMVSRSVTIYQYVVILQYNVVQYNSIHLLQHINILHRAIYCNVLCVLCEPKLDHWNVIVDKLLFLYET